MERGDAPNTELGLKYLHSYSPLGGWYVLGVPPPFAIGFVGGTDHASPYNYDTHVPLAFYGLPFQAGTYRTHAEPVDLVATLASLLGINAPTHSIGRVLTEMLAPATPRREFLERRAGSQLPDGRRTELQASFRRLRSRQNAKTARVSTTKLPSGRLAMTAPATAAAPDLSVTFAGIKLKNPVIAASGTFGYGIEFEDVVHLNKLGGFVVKGLSAEPMAGNPPPRLYETPAGMLNAIGLQNIGARAFIDEKLPKLRKMKNIVVFANVFGYSREDYERTIEILNEGEDIAAYELNVSCPNTVAGGIQFGSDPRSLDEVVSTTKRISRRPLIVKLSPNVTSIAQMAYVAQEAGADAISLVNTFVAMAIDPETRKPRIANVTAGLSGPAIKPIALRMVYDASKSGEDSGHRHGRNFDRGRYCGVHAGRSHSGADRNRQLLGPGGHGEDRGRAGNLVLGAPHRAGRRPDRRHGDGVAVGSLQPSARRQKISCRLIFAAIPPESLPSPDSTPVDTRY